MHFFFQIHPHPRFLFKQQQRTRHVYAVYLAVGQNGHLRTPAVNGGTVRLYLCSYSCTTLVEHLKDVGKLSIGTGLNNNRLMLDQCIKNTSLLFYIN